MVNTELKYRLLELIDQKGKTHLGKAEVRREMLEMLSEAKGHKVSKNTLSAWCLCPLDSSKQIKTSNLVILAKALNCTLADLVNPKSELYAFLTKEKVAA